MPLPSSGQISVSDINTELGRASNTANSNFAGGTTPQSGSLFKLGFPNINQTAPHAMSEWYGYNGIYLIYQSSITSSGGGTYTSSATWTHNSNTGIDCIDSLTLNASPSNISTSDKGTMIIFSIEDSNGLAYTNSFTLYYYKSVSSNNDIKVGVATAYFNSSGFLVYNNSLTIANYDTNFSAVGEGWSIPASTQSSPRPYLIFYLQGQDSTNSANVTIFDINTFEPCPV
jgi:hypothetical protein